MLPRVRVRVFVCENVRVCVRACEFGACLCECAFVCARLCVRV